MATTDDTESARQLIATFTALVEPASTRAALAQWKLSTYASPEAENEAAEASVALARLYADDATHAEAKRLHEAALSDPRIARQVHLLYLGTLAYRRDPQTLERIVRLETELEGAYSTYRGELGTERLNENQIREILRTEPCLERRRVAWEASKAIGPLVAPRILELARLRNEVARKLGYRDWFAMALSVDELDEGWLFNLLDRLDEATQAPFTAEKARIDAEASDWLKVPVEELMPWDYQDVFFQEAPTTKATSIEHLMADRDVAAAARSFYEDLGFGGEVAAIYDRSDLYPRENKSQHAFCTHIDRSGDVRILCNVTPSERWLETTLHELGHGIYDLGVDRSLPWLLRSPSHIFATEAIAMLMGRRARDPNFLRRYIGERSAEEEALDKALLRRRMLMLVRWVTVMTRFEQELYAEPVREAAELGKIWWDLVERYQGVRRPAGDRPTDWATKIHIALAPVYYQNYLLGELAASQIEDAIVRTTGKPLVGNQDAAAFLRERYFKPGASVRWDKLIEDATGSPLSPERFAGEFVTAGAQG
jgi:peptidyl-dipeptidase A